jgi:sulfonate transport system permease protein
LTLLRPQVVGDGFAERPGIDRDVGLFVDVAERQEREDQLGEAISVFFPIYINTQHGIRSVDPQLVEMGRIYGMTPWELFWRAILQGALPSIFVGVRFGLGIMWLTLIVAETIAASSGIGYMAMQAREFLLLDVVVLSILIYALLGKAADSAARVLERVCLAWHPAFQKSASL